MLAHFRDQVKDFCAAADDDSLFTSGLCGICNVASM